MNTLQLTERFRAPAAALGFAIGALVTSACTQEGGTPTSDTPPIVGLSAEQLQLIRDDCADQAFEQMDGGQTDLCRKLNPIPEPPASERPN